MTPIYPQDLQQFLRRYRFPGGLIRGVRIRHRAENDAAVEFRLTVREAIQDLGTEPRKVKLNLRLTGVEEYRFQMRPGQPKSRIADARISYLSGLFFINLDAWSLEPGEQPQLFDFRASEVYAAGRELGWEEAGKREGPG